MKQPNYTWWPWRMLAVIVGLTSGLTATLWLAEPEERIMEDALGMTLAIFAGGNALILGLSIGDLGRTILALLVSVGIGSLFLFLPLQYSLLAPVAIVPTIAASLSAQRTLLGFGSAAVLGLGAILIGTAAYVVALLLVEWLWSLVIRGGRPELLAVPVACAVGNAYLVGFLFRAARRVEAAPPRGGVEDQA